jgi:hypothetical protein
MIFLPLNFCRNIIMNTIPILHRRRSVVLIVTLSTFITACGFSLFGPDPFPAPFNPTLEWVKPTYGAVMDVNPSYIFSFGNNPVNGERRLINEIFKPDGTRVIFEETPGNWTNIREVVADDQPHYGNTVLADLPSRNSNFYTVVYGEYLLTTNPYTHYNTKGRTTPYPESVEEIGPAIAKGPNYVYRLGGIKRSAWLVGTFTDKFQPDYFVSSATLYSPTYGKADCFVILVNPSVADGIPVAEQWGGPENDIAYDVASDNIGNPTVFLRAGSEFGITSATQSIVRMKTGYNIVKLDTNGLLTSTFPVKLEATGEIDDVHLALGRGNYVFILAKDEARKQYFLMKASPNGTDWTRYFGPDVSTNAVGFSVFVSPKMDLVVDSKENIYLTGSFTGTVNFGGSTSLQTDSTKQEAFAVKYSSVNVCLGATKIGGGTGVSIRLSPDENAVYVNGWATEYIFGTPIPAHGDIRNGVVQLGAFLVKFKLK